MQYIKPSSFLTAVSLIALVACMPTAANASGFALKEQGARKLGNAYAGAGSEASDPSVMFFNPAGIAKLEGNQAAIAAHVILSEVDYSETNSTLTGSDGGDAGGLFIVPNAFVVYDMNPDYKFGFMVTSPFGLETDYKDDFVGRRQALESRIGTINFGPSIAFNLDEQWSLGFGVYLQKMDVRLKQSTPLSLFGFTDGFVVLEGDSVAPAYSAGVMYEPSSSTRLGLSYRSETRHSLEGRARFENPGGAPGGVFVNTDITADAILPESWLLSGYHQINDRWAIMADIEWTRWERLDTLVIDFANPSQPNQLLVLEWQNTFFYSLGANYKLNDDWLLRGGLAFDEAPTSPPNLSARVPDTDRRWVAVGATYSGFQNMDVDFGYTHIFVKNASIERQNDNGTDFIRGAYDNGINILSVQGTYRF